MKDPLDDALGLPPLVRQVTEPTVPVPETADADYEFARKNIYELIAQGSDALRELADIAQISQHPRAYEVYSNLLKTIVDTNKDLMNLKKTQKEVSGEAGPRTVNQNLIMTSDEMLKLLKGKQ